MVAALQDVPSGEINVLFYLPTFPFAVLYSQLSMMEDPSTSNEKAQPSDVESSFVGIFDPEVTRAAAGQDTNPCEVKALKLSQASGSTGADRCLFPVI